MTMCAESNRIPPDEQREITERLIRRILTYEKLGGHVARHGAVAKSQHARLL